MKCPNCNAECTLHTYKDWSGYSCPNCHKSGTFAEWKDKPATQMAMYEELAPHFNEQFLTATYGFIGVAYVEWGSKKSPQRDMRVGYYDRKENRIVRHATFSCS